MPHVHQRLGSPFHSKGVLLEADKHGYCELPPWDRLDEARELLALRETAIVEFLGTR